MRYVHSTSEINNYNQLNFFQMRPNPHLFYVFFPLELPYQVKGYSDIDVSVLGLELLQTSLFLHCTKNPAASRNRNYLDTEPHPKLTKMVSP